MSFSFAKQAGLGRSSPAGKLKAPGADTPSAGQKRNVQVLHKLGCKVCPLNKAAVSTPKMQPELAKETLIYFIGDAPDRYADETSGLPLTGDQGALIRDLLGRMKKYCSFDNLIRDRPPKDREPTWHEIECCRTNIIRSIEQAKPKLVVGLGIGPLKWAVNSSDIEALRGRLYAIKFGTHSCYFLPVYSPEFVIRQAFKPKEPLISRFGHCFKADIARALELAENLDTPKIDTFIEVRNNIETFEGGPDEMPRLENLFDAAAKAKLKAIDLETQGLRPYSTGAAILTAALSFKDVNFSFGLDHPKALWAPNEREHILKRLKKLLIDDTAKVAHNAPFEIEWLIWLLGKEVVNHTAWECTMMQAHFIDERKGKHQDEDSQASKFQGLGFLCQQHFGVNYKHAFKHNKNNMAAEPLGEVLIYNAADTKYTLRLFKRQKAILTDLGIIDAYYDALPRQPTVALMQHIGVPVSQRVIKRIQGELKTEIDDLKTQIHSLKVVKAFTKDHGAFNPASNDDLVKIFRDYLKRPEIVVALNTPDAFVWNKSSASKRSAEMDDRDEKYSTNKSILDRIDHPLAALIVKHRNKSKMKSTYIDSYDITGDPKNMVIFPDKRLHTSFGTTTTETGRTSSSSPNLQNAPKRKDSWIRESITAPKNHLLMPVDYGQLEGCTTAMCSRDKYLVKALWDDYDIHMVWAIKIAEKLPHLIGGKTYLKDAKAMGDFRSLIKNKMVFPAFFGAASSSIRGYLEAALDLEVPQEAIDEVFEDFWQTFAGVKRWQDTLMKGYYANGFVTTLGGRRHNYPLKRNQAINMPPQGTAAELVCDAMSRLSYIASSTGQWHLHPIMNIHDDLTFFIPDDTNIIDDSINIIAKEMLTFKYPWINVPLSITIELGRPWSKVEKIAKLWSNRDV